jgi:hypothetical protein
MTRAPEELLKQLTSALLHCAKGSSRVQGLTAEQ